MPGGGELRGGLQGPHVRPGLSAHRGEGLEVGREVKEEEDLAPPSGGWSRLREGTVLLPVELQSEGEPWPCSGARLAGRQDPHTPDKDT